MENSTRPMPECYFFILYECGSTLIGLKHFCSTNRSLWLFKIGYACDQQCCIFRYILRRVLYEKNSTVTLKESIQMHAYKHLAQHTCADAQVYACMAMHTER